MNNDTLKKLH